jgi:hypothetical protein
MAKKKKGMKPAQIIGWVLALAGAVVLVLGLVWFIQYNQSAAGKIGNFASKIVGKSTDEAIKDITMMVCGGAALIVGLILGLKK